jgi:beta-galactosidase GanA
LVTAHKARVEFKPSSELKDKKTMIDRIEEGHFENGKWIMERVWNGDQTDWGLNFTARTHVLKVKMASYTTE